MRYDQRVYLLTFWTGSGGFGIMGSEELQGSTALMSHLVIYVNSPVHVPQANKLPVIGQQQHSHQSLAARSVFGAKKVFEIGNCSSGNSTKLVN
jgi:hypothetical protein